MFRSWVSRLRPLLLPRAGESPGSLDGLRRYWIFVPTTVISLFLFLEGFLEHVFPVHWMTDLLLHVCLVAMLTGLAYVYSDLIFAIVREHQAALRRANQELEARVRERTAALTKTSEALAAEVAEHARAAESLRKLSSAVEQTADAVCITDREGVIRYINRAFERLSGHTLEEVRGKTPRVLKSGMQDAAFYERLWGTILEGGVFRGDVINRRKDGTLWYSELTIAPIRDPDGEVTSFVSTHRDITERIEAQARLRESEEQLRAFAAHLQSVREEERTLIAREVHDELGQALTGLRYDVTWVAGRVLPDQAAVAARTKDMLKIVDDAIRSVRRISTELRPELLDDLGLAAAIEWQAQEFQQRTGIECCLHLEAQPGLDSRLSTALFRIVQEALTNVARHADAARVEISLRAEAGRLALAVRDDGRGITEQAVADRGSLGLLGMRERAALFGGTVSIVGRPGSGTALTVEVPLGPPSVAGEA